MIGSSTDIKNIELAKQLSRLRDHIEIQRVIGLNVERLRDSSVSGALLGYMQLTALESLAMQLAKIYERTKKFDLNSIAGTINSIEDFDADQHQLAEIKKFSADYGSKADVERAAAHLRKTYSHFCREHNRALDLARHFRNKFGAHSEAGAERKNLPSQAEFDALFDFAYAFYCLVACVVVGVGPATIECRAGVGFARLLNDMGVSEIRRDFGPDE